MLMKIFLTAKARSAPSLFDYGWKIYLNRKMREFTRMEEIFEAEETKRELGKN